MYDGSKLSEAIVRIAFTLLVFKVSVPLGAIVGIWMAIEFFEG